MSVNISEDLFYGNLISTLISYFFLIK